jgi:tetratricopeptide (TPR) repeat protein
MKTILLLFFLVFSSNFIFCQTSSVDYKNSHDSAITFLINGDYDNALSNINKAIALNPTYADSYYIRGNIYQQKTNYRIAIQEYLKAIKLDPNHIDAISKCGICYAKMNDKSTACIYIKRACDMGNNDGCNIYYKFCN